MADTLLYRGRPVTPLAFGTSGLRGLVTDITDLEAYLNTLGFLEYLEHIEPDAERRVLLGGDLRPSTDSDARSILRAVARACVDAGFSPIHCGKLPTPALAYFGFESGLPSIMVTGSHIPFDRNGIKFNLPGREVLKSDEALILEAVARVRAREYARPAHASHFDAAGMFSPGAAEPLPAPDSGAELRFEQRYLEFFPNDALQGLSIAVYQHSAVGRDLLTRLLSRLGARVVSVGRSEAFVPIDTEAVDAARLSELEQLYSDARARHGEIHALVSTDGDSDRPLLLAVKSNGGLGFVAGDRLGMLVADYLEADAIAVPVSSTDAIEMHFSGRAEVRRTRIGSPWVIEAMQRMSGARRVGWEANGGFLVGTPLTRQGRALAALPTRDAFLPLLATLHSAKARGIDVWALASSLPERFSHAGLIDVPVAVGAALSACYTPGIQGLISVEFAADAAEWVDGSGVRRVASAEQARVLSSVRHRLELELGPERGFGRIQSLSFLDGIRCHFENGEIAHVRASGNAPQVRMYAVAGTEERARQIIDEAVASKGALRALVGQAQRHAFVRRIRANIEHTAWLFREGAPAAVIGAVSGSSAAQRFWQRTLDGLCVDFRAERAISLCEDLPTNQAFGLLLMWQRLRDHWLPGRGVLMAFVFGEGTRATPLTETESAQKPAIASFVKSGRPGAPPAFRSMVGLALGCFAPVEAFLRRSGFDGVVVKWGDEVQIPARDLSGTDALFDAADVVRFVSMRPIAEEDARSKDWLGVDADGNVTAFIPRRPLAHMRVLAGRGLLQTRGQELWGGINLGSIGVSRVLLDALLHEFADEVNDASADRKQRPDLDPQFFSVLMIALIDDPRARQASYLQGVREVPALARVDQMFPELLARLRTVVERFAKQHGRKPRVVALDFGDQYWGDIGQHSQIYRFYMALNDPGSEGEIARALAGLSEERDEHGNLIDSETHVAAGVEVKNSVLIGCRLSGTGRVEASVLIGTRADSIVARQAFDVQSTVSELELAPRAGSYKLVSHAPVLVATGERVTTLFLPDGRELLLRVHEDLDLRDREHHYDVPVLDNPLSFREAHELMGQQPAVELERRRQARAAEVLGAFGAQRETEH